MQLTIEIPEKLAKQLEPAQDRVADIIARGLRRSWSGNSGLRREIISFLAGRPTVKEILEFRPSDRSVKRSRKLLANHENGSLTEAEEAELDEMCEVDKFVSLIKAEILRQSAHSA